MCDEEEIQSNHQTSEQYRNNRNKSEKISSGNQQGSSSFKLNRRSSLNDSIQSPKHFSPRSTTTKSPMYSSSIRLSPVNPSSSDTVHIPHYQRTFVRPSSSQTTISTDSSRPIVNDRQQHPARTYVYLKKNPSSPIRLVT